MKAEATANATVAFSTFNKGDVIMIKKLSAISLAFLMLASLFVTSAFAAEPAEEIIVTTSNEFE